MAYLWGPATVAMGRSRAVILALADQFDGVLRQMLRLGPKTYVFVELSGPSLSICRNWRNSATQLLYA